jgi:predicted nucleic acid-binding protein
MSGPMPPATAAHRMSPPGLVTADFVIDAGIAIKWYVPEVLEAESKRVLDRSYSLHVPELFFAEFGNILWKKARVLKVPEITVQEGRGILDLLLQVPLTVHPMAPLIGAAYDAAVGPERSTVYDCCYLALARDLGCRLVTADRAFYDAMRANPHGTLIHWVADPL